MWIHEQLGAENQHLVGPVVNMLGRTALRTKSPEHAKLFLQTMGAMLPGSDPDSGGHAGGGITVTNNFLVPRPDYAAAALAASQVPALPAAPVSKIPVVNVR